MSDLQQTLQIIGQSAYSSQGAGPDGNGTGTPEGVVEGEYTVD
jgi:hypothetical protein